MDRIQAMQVFTRVVETGSFARAAETLSMQKAKATRLVQWLEVRLQVQLLQRTTRRVTLTTDGAAYYEQASRVLDDLADIEATMRNARATPGGRLRVEVGSAIGRRVLIAALPGFFARHPDIQLEIGGGDHAVDRRRDGVDCGIRVGDPDDDTFVAQRIGTVRFDTVAAPDYLRAHGMPQHPAQLSSKHAVVNFLSWRTGRRQPLWFERDGEVAEIVGRYTIALDEASAHLEAVVAGLGIGQVARCAAEPHLRSGALVAVLGDWRCRSIPLHGVYSPKQRHSARVRAFLDWAREVFDRHPSLTTRNGALPVSAPAALRPLAGELADATDPASAPRAACAPPATSDLLVEFDP